MAEQPALTFLYQQIQGLNPERGEDGVISGFRREDGRQDADFFDWQTPTLMIVGDQDAIFPPSVISEVQKIIPGSRMEIAVGAAHSAHFEKADEFNAHLSAFFAGVLAEQTAGAPAD
jgi:pimeloyl-ACP methyl ester carboxylesterase